MFILCFTTSAKIAADAITSAKIADDAIDSEHIANGAIDTAHIGDNQVTVPNSFYKIVYSNKKKKMIGFIMPNKKSNNHISNYVTTIDSIESITKIDFFSQLDDLLEKELESNVNLFDWNFKNN